MPQLDKLSFLPQLLWFFSIFFLLLVIFSQSILPSLAFTLKIRSRLLEDFNVSKGSDIKDLEFLSKETKDQLDSFMEGSENKVSFLSKDISNLQKLPDYLLKESVILSSVKKVYMEESISLQLVYFGALQEYKS